MFKGVWLWSVTVLWLLLHHNEFLGDINCMLFTVELNLEKFKKGFGGRNWRWWKVRNRDKDEGESRERRRIVSTMLSFWGVFMIDPTLGSPG